MKTPLTTEQMEEIIWSVMTHNFTGHHQLPTQNIETKAGHNFKNSSLCALTSDSDYESTTAKTT